MWKASKANRETVEHFLLQAAESFKIIKKLAQQNNIGLATALPIFPYKIMAVQELKTTGQVKQFHGLD